MTESRPPSSPPQSNKKTPPQRVILLVSSSLSHSRQQEITALQSSNIPPTQPPTIQLKGGIETTVVLCTKPAEMIQAIEKNSVDGIIIDNRRRRRQEENFSATLAGRTLPELLAHHRINRGIRRRGILVILPQSGSTAHHAYAVGSLQLGGIMVDPPSLDGILETVARAIVPQENHKVALCLAGGGIEGMFFELGVLRALNAHLAGSSVVDFSVYSGISAGAVICAFLANGVQPQTLSDALHGRPSPISPLRRGMVFDPNTQEWSGRTLGAVKDLFRGQWLRRPVDTALKFTPTAIFSGNKLRRYLEREFTKPGMTNDFNLLKKALFIGVTDQDTGRHISFGDVETKDIPISQAVRASMAMTPYYPPEKINGRYFIDGIFTRNINLDIAVAHGARLIICIDPLTPFQTEQAGYVSSKGGLFTTVQSVKSIIRTRLSEVIDRAEETYPDVTVCVFSPTPQDMELMSGTMMRFFYRVETDDRAFDSASHQILNDFDWLSRDFARHGLNLIRPRNH